MVTRSTTSIYEATDSKEMRDDNKQQNGHAFSLSNVGYGIGSVDGVAKRVGDTPSATPRSTTTMVRLGELLDRGDVPSTRKSDCGIGNQEPDKGALELCRAPMRDRIAHIRGRGCNVIARPGPEGDAAQPNVNRKPETRA